MMMWYIAVELAARRLFRWAAIYFSMDCSYSTNYYYY